MTRDPSLHIRKKDFAQVLKKLLVKHKIKTSATELLVNDLFIACRSLNASNRSISVTNQKLLAKTQKVNSSSLQGAALFSELLTVHRRKLKHRGIEVAKPGSEDWLKIKEITGLANQFAAEFDLKQREAYSDYIELALTKMKRYALNKIPSLHTPICEDYEALLNLEADKTPSETEKAYAVYTSIVANKTGIPDMGYRDDPKKYSTFITIKDEARNLGVSVKIYIEAQFEAFSWRDGVPDPLQMIGPKAWPRVSKYCFEHGINVGKEEKKKVDWSSLKKLK